MPEPSAVGTIVGGDAGLALTTGLSEISLGGVSFGRAPLRSLRSCAPISIGESIGAAGANGENAGSCCAVAAGC